ncbi:unnamed protein product [Blumeria hordei]|uniref:Single-stranded DNA-binding protein n=2 Tax=Blumeria hordei TaxID=2867405 RepID=A0A383UM15_BLUHO|nr:ssDNA binding protein [Blumeria hordei DH14]SZF01374.1 unnamed protein product [Blumeria hordei]
MPISLISRRAPSINFLRNFSSNITRQNIAKITLIGRLGDRPQLLKTGSGQELLKYSVAVSGPGEDSKPSWYRVAAFMQDGRLKDTLSALEKGTLVYVEGDTTMRSYEDAEGSPRVALDIIQRKFYILSNKNREE